MARYKTNANGQMYIPDMTDEEVILYSTGCPKCRILETKLQNKGVYYTKNTSVDEMEKLGFTAVPVLSVDGKYFEFGDAVKWINDRKEN